MDWLKKNWKFLAVVAVAVLVLAIVIVAVMPKEPSSNPVIETPPEDGAETGVYYYDTAAGEYVLSLNSGNVFTIAGPDLNKSGKYAVTANGYELDFIRDEDGTGIITKDGDVLSLQYKDKTMLFLLKKTFAVSFNANGGSAVESVNVLNGKTVSKPADPQKEGSVFIGWYADEACTQLYDFSAQVITANTTVYAKWAETVVGQNEYVVDFDLGYEAEGYQAMTTIGGKLYNVPTPVREGYTFGGWWISMTEQGDELTYKYNEDMVFQASSTLFAVWTQTPASGSLEAPMVEVFADSIKWNTIKGASTYTLKITDMNGQVILEEPMGTTTKNYNFNELEAGEYTIEVTAVGSVADKTSETTVRHFVNKALNRVSLFTVVDGGILLWNGVEGAQKYLVTVKCGDHEHVHTLHDNGTSTTYLFTGCAMQPGGIEFVITAVADGKASSVSETFVYERKLDAVGQILYNAETQSFYWSAVANAAKYMVTVTVNGETYTVDNGSATTFSVKNLSGEIALAVVPATQGFNAPEASVTTYNKTSLATPDNLTFSGNILSWDAVDGATGYMVKINDRSFSCDTNSMDLSAQSFELEAGLDYEICVMAVGAENSLYSDVVATKYRGNIISVSYNNRVVTWSPVLGVDNYQIRVNGIVVANVTGTTSAEIRLSRSGLNTIEVRYTDLGGSAWTSTEVYAYAVVYNSRSGSGVETKFVAIGDTLELPTNMTMEGYDFTGWYNSPDGAAGNGSLVTETQFNGNGTLMLYGNWNPKTYYIEFVGVAGSTNIAENEKMPVSYLGTYKLPVPENPNAGGEFVGWYTGAGASGTPLTDSQGNCYGNYTFTRDTYAYPYYDTGVLSYELQADGTYAVKKGPNVASAANVRIPEFYKGIRVTTILENAFYGVTTMEKLEIPATIITIGTGAIPTSATLKEINVYTDVTQTNYEVFFSSSDGALLRHDMGTVYLEAFPRGKTGTYVIPDNVNVIRDKVFRYSGISKLIVGNGVTMIMQNAFYSCSSLTTLEFKGEGTAALTIDPNAFYNTMNIRTLRLPARLESMNLQILNVFSRLSVIEVEEGGTHYSSVDNMICNATGDAILYAPMGVSGEYTIPKGIREIGEMAFLGRNNVTKLIIPAYVDTIGYGAFQGCVSLTEVVVEGSRSKNLTIDGQAFVGCSALTTVTFQGNGTNAVDTGVTTIGAGAFEGLTNLTTVTFEAGTNIVIGDSAFSGDTNLNNPVYAEGSKIQSIGSYAFAGCSKMTEVYIPATVTTVGSGAFSGCTNVTDVVFAPNGKQVSFGANVFENCRRLTTIELPATLSQFDGTVFAGCVALENIVIDPANQYLVTYEGALYTKDYSELLFYPKALDGNLSKLHPQLTKIGDKVFEGNLNIQTVNISKNITHIGNRAFYNCANLTSVTIEQDGTALSVGSYAFYGCSGLKTITLPAYTASIGASAFELSGLTSFVIPEALTAMPTNMLKGTKITSIILTKNLESVADGVFANCTQLTSVTFEAGGTKPLTLGTQSNTNMTNGTFYNTSIQQFILDNRVTEIGAYAFYNQNKLRQFKMNDDCQLTTIGQYAFAVDSSKSSILSNVTLGNHVVSIGDYAFYKSIIIRVKLASTIEYIGAYAFADGTRLSELNFVMDGTTDLSFDLTIGAYAFKNSTATTVTFPARLTSAYTFVNLSNYNVTGQFKNFYTIFDGNTNLQAIYVEEGCKNFASIDGILYEKDEFGNPTILLYCPRAKTGDVVIAKEVTKVENAAFANSNVSTVTFEEYDRNDPNYAKPLLEIGNGAMTANSGIPVDLAVFSPGTTSTSGGGSSSGGGKDERSDSTTTPLSSIVLPSHLKRLGVECFYNLTVSGTVSGGGSSGGGKDERSLVRSVRTAAGQGITFNQDAHLEAIQGRAFDRCTGITTLNLPAVDNLGIGAFNGMTGLVTVTFAAGSQLKLLPNNLFQNCAALTTFTVPASVTKLGDYVFQNCASLKTLNFEAGSQLQTIGQQCFNGSGLVSLVLPDSVEYIGDKPFLNCNSLKSVKLSKNLTALSTAMFYGCNALENIEVSDNSPNFKSVDGVLYDLMLTIVYAYPNAKNPAGYQIPETVIGIYDYAFAGFQGESMILPEGLETIGNSAFRSSHLKSIHIPANVVSIGEWAFYQDDIKLGYSLNSLTFAPDSKLKTISKAAFRNNPQLKSVDLPDNVTTIGYEAFASCTGMENIMLPAALRTIDNYAFSNMYNLKTFTMQEGLSTIGNQSLYIHNGQDYSSLTELYIPSSVTSIGYGAFQNQMALKNITFAPNSSLTTLGYSVFEDCISLESITLPASLRSLGKERQYGNMNGSTFNIYESNLFTNCKSLKYVDMSACTGLVDLSARMFAGCVNVETLKLPPKVTTIGDFFFGTKMTDNYGRTNITEGLISLKEIVIPATVTSIGGYAFYGCTSLESIIFEEGNTMTALGSATAPASNPFSGLYMFANTTSLKVAVLPQNLTFIGTGCFENSTVEVLEMPSSVQTICDYAFKNCVNITDAGLSANLKYIGNEAFYNCYKLESADVSFGLEYIGAMAFGNCRSLKRAHIPATVTTIAGNPFMGCIGVESFDLDRDNAFYTMDENGVLYDKGMFTLLYYPASLTAETFEIPSSVQEIAIGAFSGAQLKHLVVPNQITEIPDYAFQYSDLETVTFHKAITSIGAHAFDGCANLNDVTIYNNIKNLGDYAFANCTSLTNFVFEDVPEGQEGYHIGTHFFDGCTSITQIIVPNEIVFAGAESGTNCMPDYMFANTGIVNAVIPARITDLSTEGVFFNCKQLVSVDFECKWLSGYNIGELFFYGCSSLKSIEIPCGLGDPFTIGNHSVEGLESSGNYIFGECTSLESVVVYIDFDYLSTGFFTFYNCTSLTSIEIIKVGDVIVDEYGDVVEYTDLTERCFGFVNVGAFQGCISLKDVKMYHGSFAIYGNAFAGSGFETLHLETLRLLEGYDHYGFDDKVFSGMPCLKSIFIGKIFTNTNIFAISQNVFSDVETEVNVYFYLYTREEVEAFCRGDMKWMENASDKVTFYFKEDLPEGLEIPESLSEIMTESPKDKDDGGGKGDER